MGTMQDSLPRELQCYAYRRGSVWHLESVASLPDADRQAMLARRAPWNIRLGLELLSRIHNVRSKWGKGREKVRHGSVIHLGIAAPG